MYRAGWVASGCRAPPRSGEERVATAEEGSRHLRAELDVGEARWGRDGCAMLSHFTDIGEKHGCELVVMNN